MVTALMSTELETRRPDSEPFSTSILHGATFRIDWTQNAKVAKRGGTGTYDAPCILAEIKGYVVPIWVELRREDFDALRLLKLSGIKTYTCTLGQKAQGERYAPRIFAGGKDW
jgi:hypothetical protein